MKPLHNRNRIPIRTATDLEMICCDIFHEFLESFDEESGLIRKVDLDVDCIGDEHWSFIYTAWGEILVRRILKRLTEVCEAHFQEYEFEIQSHLFQEY